MDPGPRRMLFVDPTGAWTHHPIPLMTANDPQTQELNNRLKMLMSFRLLFTSLLLGSTIIFQLGENPSPLARPLLALYGLITAVFLLSFVYALMINRIRRQVVFAYVQIFFDSGFVTLILLVTGGFASVFSFLYLVVIIYTSMLLFIRGSMIVAALCTIQYGLISGLEYYQMVQSFGSYPGLTAAGYAETQVLFKVVITAVACFAVAYLSGLLAEQARRSKRELEEMENRVKRIEKLASMGEMAAGMAHEIKNPLASLAGAIQMLREDLHNNPYHDKLMQIALRETDRLGSLVHNFLLFARPPAGKPQPILLSRMVAEVVELFSKDGSCSQRIEITTDLAPDVWTEMDPIHLRQVLWNLLSNAAEVIEAQGRIHVDLSIQKNGAAIIRITDDGIGIPPDQMPSIFDPFYTTKPKGTGLGLSIVYSILESYQGWLDVDSQAGQGTSVSLRLSRLEGNPAAA